MPSRREIVLSFVAAADRAIGDTDGLSALVESFSKMITGEFYAVTGNDQLVGRVRDNALKQYCNFMNGFQYGSMKAADVIYMLVFNTAYSIGYSSGFRDGYSQGYAAGYQAGYGKGYADGKDAATALGGIFSDVSGVLQSADTFLILSDAEKVGSVIVSIASLF